MGDAEKEWNKYAPTIHYAAAETPEVEAAFMEGHASRDAEVSELTRLLAESRARYGDLEARLVEAEAVIAAAKTHLSREVPRWDEWWAWTKKAITILAASPSVVLADHDKEVAAQAVEAAIEHLMRWAGSQKHSTHIGYLQDLVASYRVADQNGGE
jgi:hypothetical protein